MSGISLEQFLAPVVLSLQVSLLSSIVVFIAAIAVAKGMCRARFPGKTAVETLLLLPLVLPPTVIGFVLLLGLGRRSWLGGMTTIPHALSRRAIETIGFEELAVPPKAQAIGICRGLDVRAVHYIDVGRSNPIRRRRQKLGGDPLEQLIIGDHLEAIDWYIRSTNERGNMPDLMRVREIVR